MKKLIWFLVFGSLLVPALALAHGRHNGNHENGNHERHHRGSSDQPVSSPVTTPTPPTPPIVPSGNEITLNAYLTGYGIPDNDPAGSDTTYINGSEGHAGGTGTYADPITIAVGYVGEKPDFPQGTIFYVPNVERYFVAKDTCAECHQTPKGVQVWLDQFVGGTNTKGVLSCEDDITGDFTVIENPKSTYKVTAGSIYSGSCTQQFGNTLQ